MRIYNLFINNIMDRFKQFIEAVDLNTAKKLKLTRKNSKAYTRDNINSLFDGKDRIVISNDLKINTTISPHFDKIKYALMDLGYYTDIYHYIDNKAWKIGDFRPVKTQFYRIGKLLNAHENSEELLHIFKNDESRNLSSNKSYKVVLSRHPYDVAGQSTGRHWKSCLRLPQKNDKLTSSGKVDRGGIYCQLVKNDIREGVLVAYLVYSEDNNISNPLARITVKPYQGEDGDLAYGVGKIYGAKNNEFSKFVEDWVDDNLNNDLKSNSYFHYPHLYDDDDYTSFDIMPFGWIKDIVTELEKRNFWLTYESGGEESLLVFVNYRIPDIPVKLSGELKQKLIKLVPVRVSSVIYDNIYKLLKFKGIIDYPIIDNFSGKEDLESVQEEFINNLKDAGLYDVSPEDYEKSKNAIIKTLTHYASQVS